MEGARVQAGIMELLSKNVGLEDMAKLMDLHDKSILENLKQRHESDLIYVSIVTSTDCLCTYVDTVYII